MKIAVTFSYLFYMLMCLFGAWVVTTIDYQGPGEAAIQGWNEWSIFLYIAIIGVLLSFSVWSTFQQNIKILKVGFWLSVAILVFQLIYVVISAKGMGIVVMLLLHMPFVLGVLVFKRYLKEKTLPSNKVIQPRQPPASAAG